MKQKKLSWERMSHKVSISCKPSVYSMIEKIAYIQDMSINRTFNMALVEFISNHQMDIEQYDKIEKEMSNND